MRLRIKYSNIQFPTWNIHAHSITLKKNTKTIRRRLADNLNDVFA